MYRDSYYDKIVNLVKIEPQSQTEIHKRIGIDKITIQGIAKNLNQAVEEGKLIFLGNKVSKKDAKYLLREYFYDEEGKKLGKSWPINAHQYYIYVPNTEKFYQRLKNLLKEDPPDREIIRLYSVIELSSMFQELEFYNFNVIKRWFKSINKYQGDEHINQKIESKKKELTLFYEERNKEDPILNLLQFTPLMYWCAFKRPVPMDHPEYSPEKDIIRTLTEPLINKLNSLLKNR